MSVFESEALALAGVGFHVFPCAPRSKQPMTPHGFHDATFDEGQIRTWWRAEPLANVAIACCEATGVLALDIDPRRGGRDALEELEDRWGRLPHTVEAHSGGADGGWHLYFHRPAGLPFRGELARGIDLKASGYVMAPPSIHPDTGRAYTWELSSDPRDGVALAELPTWALALAVRLGPDGDLTPTGAAATCFVARAFAAAGLLGRTIDGSKVCVRCPWESEHTNRGGDSSTVVFAATAQYPDGKFWCSHTSHGCIGNTEALAALPPEALAEALVQMASEAAA